VVIGYVNRCSYLPSKVVIRGSNTEAHIRYGTSEQGTKICNSIRISYNFYSTITVIPNANSYTNVKSEKKFLFILSSSAPFTALHGMQTRSTDENSVCPPVCPSVCQTRAL